LLGFATAVAERRGIPFIVADSVAGRGFKWTFRTTPIAPDFVKSYTTFLNDLIKTGRKIETLAIVSENTDYGTSVTGSLVDAASAAQIKIAAKISYNANSSDVTAQVLQLKTLNPDAVTFVSYAADATST
jgi:branched-chain amino acid transport system substrate-binding protein